MKKLLVLLLISMMFLTACECFSGFGRDVQKAGKWMENQADQGKKQ